MQIQAYFSTQKILFGDQNLSDLPAWLIQFFNQPLSIWTAQLQKAWKIQLPDAIVLLKADESILAERMRLKHQGQVKEFHEQTDILLKLQSGFERAGVELSPALGFSFTCLDLDAQETPSAFAARFAPKL